VRSEKIGRLHLAEALSYRARAITAAQRLVNKSKTNVFIGLMALNVFSLNKPER
jgi:hypothetical protein